jgi:hypothetical protein
MLRKLLLKIKSFFTRTEERDEHEIGGIGS